MYFGKRKKKIRFHEQKNRRSGATPSANFYQARIISFSITTTFITGQIGYQSTIKVFLTPGS